MGGNGASSKGRATAGASPGRSPATIDRLKDQAADLRLQYIRASDAWRLYGSLRGRLDNAEMKEADDLKRKAEAIRQKWEKVADRIKARGGTVQSLKVG